MFIIKKENKISNYFYKDIGDPKEPWPDYSKAEFLTLEKYHEYAMRAITKLAPALGASPEKVRTMLNSEDYISEVAMKMMQADMTYDLAKARRKTRGEGRRKDRYSWRNQGAIYAIQSLLGITQKRKNKILESLDAPLIESENGDKVSLTDLEANKLTLEPSKRITESERRSRVKKYVNFLLKNSDLSDQQRKVIELKYFEGLQSNREIGESLTPPVSRQNVNQLLSRGIQKLRQTALGTENA